MDRTEEEIKKFVRERYGNLAREKGQSCCGPQAAKSSCCADTSCCQDVGGSRLYTEEEIRNLPEDVTGISLGCGNPTAIAGLKDGEVVLDLGSGGGIDCFIAARKVGEKGRVIGLDMTPEMVRLARQNAGKIDAGNVEFRLGEMERMPVDDRSVDVIISNCVINLSPDKDAVFREAYRVLKPGGRLCVSDMVLLGELPKEIKDSLGEWAGCVAGALLESDYLDKIRAAGFTDVTSERETMPIYIDKETVESMGLDAEYINLADKVASVRVMAFKSAS